MFRTADTPDPVFTDTLELDLDDVEPSLAGPKRPQDRVAARATAKAEASPTAHGRSEFRQARRRLGQARARSMGANFELGHGDVVIAAITSCTNTSNPSVMIARGPPRPQRASRKGLKPKPWVKTSLAPGLAGGHRISRRRRACRSDLDALGFNLVGYGCTTCIGNSGPLPEAISKAINDNDLVAASVLSGNRNFEGRVNPDVRANYLASPPLVVAYALAGSMQVDIATEPLGHRQDGKPVYLNDIWPSSRRSRTIIRTDDHARDVHDALRRRVQGRRELAGDRGRGRPDLSTGTSARPTCRTRPISRA